LAARDPFEALGLAPTFDLDPDELEARYLALSRACHPDHHAATDPLELPGLLARAAAVNDAYRTLRDPWSRARALLDRLDAGAFDRHKRLDPGFLAEAMDLAEEVDAAEAADAPALETRLRRAVEARLERIAAALCAGDAAAAATLIHQSTYFRKALADLAARLGPRTRSAR
jgi:molecular chaperone HscB